MIEIRSSMEGVIWYNINVIETQVSIGKKTANIKHMSNSIFYLKGP